MSKNQIKGLPENIGSLVNLKHLNLSYNQISTLPATMGQLKNLKHLDLKNNHLAQKFADIVGLCHNELQCQQAAKNLLKAFSPQSDNDKKKKQNGNSNATAKLIIFCLVFNCTHPFFQIKIQRKRKLRKPNSQMVLVRNKRKNVNRSPREYLAEVMSCLGIFAYQDSFQNN